MTLKIITKATKKDANKKYNALVLENAGRTHFLSFDNLLIMGILDISPNDLAKREIGNETILLKGD